MKSKTAYNIFGLGGRMVYLVIAAVLIYFLAAQHPIKFELLVGKATYATLGAILGYFIDVILFPNYRLNDLAVHKDEPHISSTVAAAQLRRALIVGCCVLGICLGI